jgi:hypothetical protein
MDIFESKANDNVNTECNDIEMGVNPSRAADINELLSLPTPNSVNEVDQNIKMLYHSVIVRFVQELKDKLSTFAFQSIDKKIDGINSLITEITSKLTLFRETQSRIKGVTMVELQEQPVQMVMSIYVYMSLVALMFCCGTLIGMAITLVIIYLWQ